MAGRAFRRAFCLGFPHVNGPVSPVGISLAGLVGRLDGECLVSDFDGSADVLVLGDLSWPAKRPTFRVDENVIVSNSEADQLARSQVGFDE